MVESVYEPGLVGTVASTTLLRVILTLTSETLLAAQLSTALFWPLALVAVVFRVIVPGTTLFTVTETGDESVECPAASYAFARSVWPPFAADVVFQLHWYGAVVSVDCSPLSR